MANAAAALDLLGKRMKPGIIIDDRTPESLGGRMMIMPMSMRIAKVPMRITLCPLVPLLDRRLLARRATTRTGLLRPLFQQALPLLHHPQKFYPLNMLP